MKKFVFIYSDENEEHFVYYIKHPVMPSIEELQAFLALYSHNIEPNDTVLYQINEIKDIEFLTVPDIY